MSWILGVLAVLFVLDGLRMRARLTAIPTLAAAGPSCADHTLVTAPGVQVPDDVRGAAAAHVHARGLDVLDLVPARLETRRLLGLAQIADPTSYRRDPLAKGRTAGHALLVSEAVRGRLGEIADPTDPVAFVRLCVRLKQHAPRTTDLAVAPELPVVPEDVDKRRALAAEILGGALPIALTAQMVVFALLFLGLALPGARLWGAIALVAFHLQPALALAGTALRPPDLVPFSLARLPLEIFEWVRMLRGRWRPADPDLVAERRPVYESLLAGDPQRFFAEVRDTCPVCDSRDLRVRLRTSDLIQHKPGRFTLSRCEACGHIFQNPGLSIAGLEFYYRDFYDGLGERWMDFIFGASSEPYARRARMARQVGNPKRWLDVGAGHGHFCVAAMEELPETQFDGLDISQSIDEAAQRGWIAMAYRGLFPDLAPQLASSYEAVSMSHYLEHTLDPRAELAAAATVLAPGGLLMIEVPDPESALGRVLGRYWIPWFQPQHQHLLSVKNLERLLREAGFEPVTWHRGEAHQRVDFFFAAFLLLERLAPPNDLPWRPRAGWGRRAWRAAVWTLGTPLVLLARVADGVLAPAITRFGMSNTYRVLAKKVAAPERHVTGAADTLGETEAVSSSGNLGTSVNLG